MLLFQDKYELVKFGSEFQNSYIMLKLLDRNRVLKINKDISKAARGIDEKDIDKMMEKSEEVVNLMYDQALSSFVSGEIYDSELGKERPMKKEDINFFPPKIIQEINAFIQGSLPKKD